MRSKPGAQVAVVVGLIVGVLALLNRQSTREARANKAADIVTSDRASKAPAGEGAPVTLETIIKSWNARQGNARTLDFSGQGTQSFPARAVSADEATLPTGPKGEAFSVPASTFNIKVRFVGDGSDRFRHECVERLLDYSKKDYVRQHSIDIFTHDNYITYLSASKLEFPIATIQNAEPYV